MGRRSSASRSNASRAGSITKDDDNSSTVTASSSGPGWDITSLLRRPYLQIVVLFASDPKVMAYARAVQMDFANVGVDSWVQTELTPAELELMPPGSVTVQAGHRWVKPEHLVTVINCTSADSLIVLGDRNMRNDSCQRAAGHVAAAQQRKQGRLLEQPVDVAMLELVRDWAVQSGLVHFVNGQLKPSAALRDSELVSALKELTGHGGHASDRMKRLSDAARDLEQWGKRQAKFVIDGDIGNSSRFSDTDQKMVTLLTRSQTSAIKLHSELMEALEEIQELKWVHVTCVLNKDDSAASAAQMDRHNREHVDNANGSVRRCACTLGLGIGSVVNYEHHYAPDEPLRINHHGSGVVDAVLRDRLIHMLRELLTQVDEHGGRIGVVSGGKSLWSAYRESVDCVSRVSSLLKGKVNQAKLARALEKVKISSGGGAGSGNDVPNAGPIAVEADDGPSADQGQTTEEQMLTSMGFALPLVKRTLANKGNNVEQALNSLLEGGSDTTTGGSRGNDTPNENEWSVSGKRGRKKKEKGVDSGRNESFTSPRLSPSKPARNPQSVVRNGVQTASRTQATVAASSARLPQTHGSSSLFASTGQQQPTYAQQSALNAGFAQQPHHLPVDQFGMQQHQQWQQQPQQARPALTGFAGAVATPSVSTAALQQPLSYSSIASPTTQQQKQQQAQFQTQYQQPQQQLYNPPQQAKPTYTDTNNSFSSTQIYVENNTNSQFSGSVHLSNQDSAASSLYGLIGGAPDLHRSLSSSASMSNDRSFPPGITSSPTHSSVAPHNMPGTPDTRLKRSATSSAVVGGSGGIDAWGASSTVGIPSSSPTGSFAIGASPWSMSPSPLGRSKSLSVAAADMGEYQQSVTSGNEFSFDLAAPFQSTGSPWQHIGNNGGMSGGTTPVNLDSAFASLNAEGLGNRGQTASSAGGLGSPLGQNGIGFTSPAPSTSSAGSNGKDISQYDSNLSAASGLKASANEFVPGRGFVASSAAAAATGTASPRTTSPLAPPATVNLSSWAPQMPSSQSSVSVDSLGGNDWNMSASGVSNGYASAAGGGGLGLPGSSPFASDLSRGPGSVGGSVFASYGSNDAQGTTASRVSPHSMNYLPGGGTQDPFATTARADGSRQ